MKLADLSLMARDLASTDDDDAAALKACLESVRQLEKNLADADEPELLACLDAVSQMIDAFADLPASEGRKKAKGVACRVLDALGTEFADVTVAKPEPPAPPPEMEAISLTIEGEEGEEPDEEEEADVSEKADMAFGRMLVELGHVTRDQVAAALRFHRSKGPRIGECLLLQGAIAPEHLLNALQIQDLLRSTPQGVCSETLNRYKQAKEEKKTVGSRNEVAQRVTEEIFFGEVLLGAEMITNEQLEKAMHMHHKAGLPVGEALVQMGALTEDDVQSGLMLQKQLRRIAGVRID